MGGWLVNKKVDGCGWVGGWLGGRAGTYQAHEGVVELVEGGGEEEVGGPVS